MAEPSKKEIEAMELKYLGHTYKVISERIDVPETTILGWFEKKGKLKEAYDLFAKELNVKRAENILEEFCVSDRDVLIATHNVMAQFAKGIPLADITMNDFEKAFKIQMLLQGRPIDIKNVNMFNQEQYDNENQEIVEMLKERKARKEKEREDKEEKKD